MRWVDLDLFRDAELLRRLGRGPVASILEMLGPLLDAQHIGLPDPGLPDTSYFDEVAATIRGQPLKALAYLPPCFSAGSQGDAGEPQRPGPGRLRRPDRHRYALRRDGELWHLTLDWRPAVLKHEQGICYVAEMLCHPREGMKQLNLAAKFSGRGSKAGSSIEVYDPLTGAYDLPSSAEPVHEAALAGDEQEARQACQARARELKEILDDERETESAKAAAREELEQIAAHLRRDSRTHRDAAKAAADCVRIAVKRFLHRLLREDGSASGPDLVRREFGEHLQRYLSIPSHRYAAPAAREARGELTGCLLYDPPPGVVWVVRL